MLTDVLNVLSGAFRDFRRVWRQLFAVDVLYKIVAFAVLTPLVGLSLKALISTSGDAFIADHDLLFFVLSPIGLATVIVVGALSIGIVALEQACLMTIAFGAGGEARVTVPGALLFGARHAGSVVRLTARVCARILLITAPFLAAGALVYYALLSRFDINYYLAEKPPAFWIAALLMGGLLTVLGFVLMRKLVSWALALPLVLFEEVDAARALAASHEKTKNHRWTVGLVLGGWIVAGAALSALASATVTGLGRAVVPLVRESYGVLVVVLGAMVILWTVANLLVTLVDASAFGLLTVRLYERLGMSRDATPARLNVSERLGTIKGRNMSGRMVLAGLAAACIAAAIIGVALVQSVRLDEDVITIAHRGASGGAPENTLAAVELAIAQQADMVEVDVQETADGEVVVIHDEDLMKIAGVDLRIHDATYNRLRSIDAGSWFAPEFNAERVPTLAQVLELCKGRTRVNIELKYYGHAERFEERVVNIVEATGMESDVVLMSLNREGIQKVRTLRPDWTVGLLTATTIGDLTRVDADFLAVSTRLVTRTFTRSAHTRGKYVYVWTVNDPINMSRMMSKGVDGIITDKPGLARAVIQWRAGMSFAERLLVDVTHYFGITPDKPTLDDETG